MFKIKHIILFYVLSMVTSLLFIFKIFYVYVHNKMLLIFLVVTEIKYLSGGGRDGGGIVIILSK